jgi:hypothetical protein
MRIGLGLALLAVGVAACDDETAELRPSTDMAVQVVDLATATNDMAAPILSAAQIQLADVVGTIWTEADGGVEAVRFPTTHMLSAMANLPASGGAIANSDPDPMHGCQWQRFETAALPPEENGGDAEITGFDTTRLYVDSAGTAAPMPLGAANGKILCSYGSGSSAPMSYACRFGSATGPFTANVLFPPSNGEQAPLTDATAVTEKLAGRSGSSFTDSRAATFDAPLPKALHIVSVNGDVGKHALGDFSLSKSADLTFQWSCDGSNTAGAGCSSSPTALVAFVVLTSLDARARPPNRAKFGVATCLDNVGVDGAGNARTIKLTKEAMSTMLGDQTSGSAYLMLVQLSSAAARSGNHPLTFSAGRGEFAFVNYP